MFDAFTSEKNEGQTPHQALEKAALDPQDLRLLSSGPRCGLSEINLPAKVGTLWGELL
jgi:aspartate ammonia-lyase